MRSKLYRFSDQSHNDRICEKPMRDKYHSNKTVSACILGK